MNNDTVEMMQRTKLISVLLVHWLVVSAELPPLYELHKHLFSSYQPAIRPVKHYNTTVFVKLGFMMSSLEGLDEAKQTFMAAGWFTLIWIDEMLTWERSKYPGLQRIDFSADKVWKPDIAIRNDAQEFVLLSHHGGHCTLTPEGKITWYLALRLETTCAINIAKFPFDTQICSIDLIQWATNITEVNFTVSSVEVAQLLFSSLNEWQVTGYYVESISLTYMDMVQVDVKFIYSLKRKPFSFIISVVVPLMFLSALNLFVFLLPAECGEKMSLSLAVVLGYSVMMTITNSLIPDTSDTVSIFGLYTVVMFFIKVLTIMCSVFTLRLHYRDPRVPMSPKCKRRLTILRLMPEHLQLKRDNPEYCVWKRLSKKLDNVCFCVFTVATVGATVTCFIALLM